MGELVHLGTMSAAAVDVVTRFESEALKQDQVPIETQHAFHAGLYARTIVIPAGVAVTGVLIKIPTMLIISGDAVVYTDEGAVRITGYRVMLGAAGRKQAFVAIENTTLTMLFPTTATAVEQAEVEFTDETGKLLSRRDDAANIIDRSEA